jgi:transcriptional regulator with XRE-family HTH domain
MSAKGTMRRTKSTIIETGGQTEQSLQLGLQLRHARLVKGLLLREVAEQSDCSESLISKIENNKAMPSINTLHRVARVLGTTVAALLNEHASAHSVVTPKQKRPILREIAVAGLESDGTEAEVLIPLGSSMLLQAILMRVQPGGSSQGLRQHEGEEVGLVIAGELLLTVAGTTYHLKKGDSFFYKSTDLHGFSNPGSKTAEIVWVNTPASL